MIETLLSLRLTAFGWILLPLAMALLALRPAWLIALLAVASVFQAPAALTMTVGAAPFGISPFIVMCGVLGLRMIWLVAGNRHRVPGLVTDGDRAYWSWAAFFAVSIAGSYVLPHLFAGVLVHPALVSGATLLTPEPNYWSVSHLAQAVNCAALWSVFTYALVVPPRERPLHNLLLGVVWAFGLSVLAGVQQRLASGNIVPLFREFWASNPGYNQWFHEPAYGPSGFLRVGLPFAEPSYASVWFASLFCGALVVAVYARSRRREALWATLLAATALLNTLGTSGIAACVLFGMTLCVFHLAYGRRVGLRPMSHRPIVLAGVVVMLCVLGAWVLVTIRSHEMHALRDAIAWTWSKVETYWGSGRDVINRHALQTLLDTYGLGAGAGSARASGYFHSLLANTGLVGGMLFVMASIFQFREALRAVLRGSATALGLLGAMLGVVIGVGVGIADQSWPILWIMLLGVFLVANRSGDGVDEKARKASEDIAADTMVRSGTDDQGPAVRQGAE